jgi:ABC-type uncharacterized transport system involved in gliding motility auxiliary subunit
MKKTFLYSTAGIVVVAVVLVALNWVLGMTRVRVDLTDGNVYSLSDATRTLVKKLDQPIRIRYYYTQGEDTVPIQVRVFAKRVEDFLAEYRAANSDKITIEKLNPQPDSDAEDQATIDGIEAQTGPTGEKFYLGLAVLQGDKKSAIPALDGNRERLLEYDLTRAITRISVKEKPVLGVMSPLPLAGNPMAMMMGQGAPQPQVFYEELQRDYDVRNVPMSADRIDDAVKTLIVVHPRGITDQAQYAIDQFVLRGGRLIAFIDPFAYFDQPPRPMPGMEGGTSSSLDKLLKAWGYTMDPGKVVLDSVFGAGDGPRRMPTVLALSGPAINTNDIATSQIPNALVPMAGAIVGKPAEGLRAEVLFRSSNKAGLIENANATKRGFEAMETFKAAGEPYPLAIRLSGKFRTAFAEGKPAAPADPKADDKAKAGEKGAPKAEEKPKAPEAPQLKEAQGETSVVIVADSDMLNDGASVSVQEIFGRRIVIPQNGNLPFFIFLVEQMAGDPALASLSARASGTRPLTVVKQMEAEAQEQYIGKLQGLEKSLNETKEKLSALEKSKGPAGAGGADAAKAAMTPEQKEEVDNFRKKVVETRRELKELRKELRADTEALEFWTKVANIALMPALVALAGLGFALSRRKRSVPGTARAA